MVHTKRICSKLVLAQCCYNLSPDNPKIGVGQLSCFISERLFVLQISTSHMALGLYSGAVVNTVALQQGGHRFATQPGAYLCLLCVYFACVSSLWVLKFSPPDQ